MTDKFDLITCGERLIEVFEDVWADASDHVKDRVRLRTSSRWVPKPSDRGVYVVSFLNDLADDNVLDGIKKVAGPSKRFLFLVEDLPAESIPEYLFRLDIRNHKRIHLASLQAPENAGSFLRRFFETLSISDDQESILDAWWDGDTFVVISPTFERLRVQLKDLPKLDKADREDREQFDIDEYGDFVYWPSLDVHMGWPQFQQAADPAARLRAEQKSERFNEQYGRAIRFLRDEADLTQRGIKGLNERTIRRIENGETRATCTAISKLAKAHKMTPSQYMSKLAKLLEPSPAVLGTTDAYEYEYTAADSGADLRVIGQDTTHGEESRKESVQIFQTEAAA